MSGCLQKVRRGDAPDAAIIPVVLHWGICNQSVA
jgi:hypothetical protein